MLRRLFKWLGIGAGVLLGLLAVGFGAVLAISELRLGRTVSGVGEPVAVTGDPAVIAEGRRLVVSRGCVDCHGQDLAGGPVLDEPIIGQIFGPNLTPGQGGIGARYSDDDFERAIRHGVDPQGRQLWIMPAQEYYFLNDGDVAAMIAYLRSLPPVDKTIPKPQVGPLGRVLYVTGQVNLLPAEVIDYAVRRESPPAGVTVEYGRYLAASCTGCHGHGYSGGPIPGLPPDTPVPTNITPDPQTGIAGWSEADFIRAMREGQRPDGSAINPFMPWKNFALMNDTELKALYLFLQGVPAKAEGNR